MKDMKDDFFKFYNFFFGIVEKPIFCMFDIEHILCSNFHGYIGVQHVKIGGMGK